MSLSGQTTVTTAGAPVALGSEPANNPVTVKALSTNTAAVYIGRDAGDSVSATTGFELSPSEQVTFQFIGNLATLLLDAAQDGEGVAWIILNA